jgi:hypothetical protein
MTLRAVKSASTFAGGAPPTPIQATALPLSLHLYGVTAANAILQVDSAGVLTRLAGMEEPKGTGRQFHRPGPAWQRSMWSLAWRNPVVSSTCQFSPGFSARTTTQT